MVSINAGDLLQPITIESFTTEKNEFGEDDRTWSKFLKASAKIEPLMGRELELARAVVETVTHKVTIRYRDGINSTMRVRYGDRLLGIGAAINVEELGIAMILYCTEEVQRQ
jgi:SPP1 family predicted phage head-tail adaptor